MSDRKYKGLADHIVDAVWNKLRERSGFDIDIDTATEQEIVDELTKIAQHEIDFYAGAYRKKVV